MPSFELEYKGISLADSPRPKLVLFLRLTGAYLPVLDLYEALKGLLGITDLLPTTKGVLFKATPLNGETELETCVRIREQVRRFDFFRLPD